MKRIFQEESTKLLLRTVLALILGAALLPFITMPAFAATTTVVQSSTSLAPLAAAGSTALARESCVRLTSGADVARACHLRYFYRGWHSYQYLEMNGAEVETIDGITTEWETRWITITVYIPELGSVPVEVPEDYLDVYWDDRFEY